ncbi:MAG: T9SS type A sorting domain-containing protein [Bacteroidia bacterium]
MKKLYFLCLILAFSAHNLLAQSWNALGTNDPGTTVKAIAVSPVDGSIYVAGTFTGVNYIAKKNPTTGALENIGSGTNGPVYTLAFHNNELYVGGNFTNAGGVAVSNVAKVSSSGTWSAVGTGFSAEVYCLYSDGTNLYAGGGFIQNGTASTNLAHIAKWNGSDWAIVGTGTTYTVRAIMMHNSVLYLGTDNISSPVYSFNGSAFTAISGLSGGKVNALASYSSYLYVGGEFTTPTFAAARYNPSTSSWGTISTTFLGSEKINALYTRANVLYIGGVFTNKGVTANANYVAKVLLQGSNPTPLQTIITDNVGGEVFAIGNSNGKVIVGGDLLGTLKHAAITSTTIGIDEISSVVSDIQLYPNPVKDFARIDVHYTQFQKAPEVRIYDMQSRLISLPVEADNKGMESHFTIDCTTLPEGNYLYTIESDGSAIASGI